MLLSRSFMPFIRLTSQDFPFSSCFRSTDDGSFTLFAPKVIYLTSGDHQVTLLKQIDDEIESIFFMFGVERKMEIDMLCFLNGLTYLTAWS